MVQIQGWTEVDRESALLGTIPRFAVVTVFDIDPANYETYYFVEDKHE